MHSILVLISLAAMAVAIFKLCGGHNGKIVNRKKDVFFR
jgi:hypothetical protein